MPRIRIIALSALATGGLALGLGATSASAAQTNIKIPPGAVIDVTFPQQVSCPGGVTGDVVIVVKSGHDNATGNPITGPYHENATIVGDGYIVAGVTDPNDPFGTGTVVAGPGQANAWFTTNENKGGAAVDQDFAHANFSGFRVDVSGKFTLNANGVPVVQNQRGGCS